MGKVGSDVTLEIEEHANSHTPLNRHNIQNIAYINELAKISNSPLPEHLSLGLGFV